MPVALNKSILSGSSRLHAVLSGTDSFGGPPQWAAQSEHPAWERSQHVAGGCRRGPGPWRGGPGCPRGPAWCERGSPSPISEPPHCPLENLPSRGSILDPRFEFNSSLSGDRKTKNWPLTRELGDLRKGHSTVRAGGFRTRRPGFSQGVLPTNRELGQTP